MNFPSTEIIENFDKLIENVYLCEALSSSTGNSPGSTHKLHLIICSSLKTGVIIDLLDPARLRFPKLGPAPPENPETEENWSSSSLSSRVMHSTSLAILVLFINQSEESHML